MTPILRPALVTLCLALAPAALADPSWPRFRGPGARGVADGQSLPVAWDVASGENVRFKTDVPGLGHSSPIVWGGRLFLTTAETAEPPELKLGDEGGIDVFDDNAEFTWSVLAVDTKSGEILWSKAAVTAKPRARRHVKSSQANATPATDGQVLATILGSEGLFVFNLDGEELWRADLGTLDPGLYGDPSSHWGYASSPIVHDGRVFVQVDRHADSFLAAYDAGSGRRLWKVARDERPGWSTPLVHAGGERSDLIVLGSVHARGYDPATGAERWRFKDEAEVKILAPFVAGDRLILAGGYRGRPIHALPLGGSGDLGASALWTTEPGGPYTSTPVAVGGRLYSVANEGILVAWDLESGARLQRRRVDEHFSASLVASDGNLYLAGEGGEVIVVRTDDELTELARNDMGEALMATPAISDGTLFVRTASALYAIAEGAGIRPARAPAAAPSAEGPKE